MEWKPEEFERAIQEVSRRATIDPEFRTLALNDARAAVAQVAGKTLPADVKFSFVDNSGSTKIVPLPEPIKGIAYEELTEEEFEAIAGGAGIPGTVQGGVTWGR